MTSSTMTLYFVYITDRNKDDGVIDKIADNYREVLKLVGEDPEREGLAKTPARAAKAMLEFTKGYKLSVQGNNICHYTFGNEEIFIYHYTSLHLNSLNLE